MDNIAFCDFKDKSKLESIFNVYGDRLIGFINSIIKDVSAAEDLMMEIFVDIIRRDLSFENEQKFKTYVYKSARNLSFNHLKKQKHFAVLDNQVLVDNLELEAKTLTDLKSKKLYEAMQKIKPVYRQALYLFYIEGFSHEEIAQINNTSERAIKNICFRAKKKLNKILKQDNFWIE